MPLSRDVLNVVVSGAGFLSDAYDLFIINSCVCLCVDGIPGRGHGSLPYSSAMCLCFWRVTRLMCFGGGVASARQLSF
jgi:hypothetical protein